MKRLVLVVVMVSTHGCGRFRDESRASVKKRAAFDLACPEASLTLKPMTEETLQGASQYGVEGCGKRAVYIETRSGYVLNTASDITEQSSTPAQEGTKP